jgi:hypothetical protein
VLWVSELLLLVLELLLQEQGTMSLNLQPLPVLIRTRPQRSQAPHNRVRRIQTPLRDTIVKKAFQLQPIPPV